MSDPTQQPQFCCSGCTDTLVLCKGAEQHPWIMCGRNASLHSHFWIVYVKMEWEILLTWNTFCPKYYKLTNGSEKQAHIHMHSHTFSEKMFIFHSKWRKNCSWQDQKLDHSETQLIVTDFNVTEINTFCIKLQSFIIIIHKHSRSLHSLEPEEWRELVIIVCSWFSFTENIFNTALIKKAE